jgi:hypothetical protein
VTLTTAPLGSLIVRPQLKWTQPRARQCTQIRVAPVGPTADVQCRAPWSALPAIPVYMRRPGAIGPPGRKISNNRGRQSTDRNYATSAMSRVG